MTVGELIEQLQVFAPDQRVVVRGYEDGVNDVVEVISAKISVDGLAGYDYYGQHALVGENNLRHIQDKHKDKEVEEAVWLKGPKDREVDVPYDYDVEQL